MEHKNINRRDFLKLLLLLPFAASNSINKFTPRPFFLPTTQLDQPNIIFFLFDTLSARNISLYGYPRETMPNLAKFAERANVYHQHHSSGNWTPTGTASLLTGTYPWTHRSFYRYNKVIDSVADRNLFSLFHNQYNTLAYTQNPLAHSLLFQFKDKINHLLNLEDGGVHSIRPEGDLFDKDYNHSFWGQSIVQGTWQYPPSSPFLSILNELITTLRYRLMNKNLGEDYPYWIPQILPGLYYFFAETVEWLKQQLRSTLPPTLSYYHFFPPHAPYAPRAEFSELFDDGWLPPQKPSHIFQDGSSPEFLNYERTVYDQFIANIDHDFGIIIDYLQELGMLENSYIIFTTDHGESLERGVWSHVTPLLYEPLIQIPLLIHKPGQTTREDIYTPTSAVDVLPTICQIAGQEIPKWAEGEALPGFRSDPVDLQRPIFSLEAKENNKFGPLTKATAAMIKWPYKLIHYFGYEELPYHFELYNLEEDPEELIDLYPLNPEIASQLETELLDKLEQVNQATP